MKTKEKPQNHYSSKVFHLAAGEGFEPSHTESESAVLPLHKPAIFSHSRERTIYYTKIYWNVNREVERILTIFLTFRDDKEK